MAAFFGVAMPAWSQLSLEAFWGFAAAQLGLDVING